MKRRLLSLVTALIMLVTMTGFAAVAEKNEDNAPVVKVDGREISFSDQKPVILEAEGRTLVPARGVFECMGARVDWDGEKRLVTINSENNITRILITIDDPVMVVYTFTSLLSADKTEIMLDAAPRIMNDRTMIPLRAISEALDATVKWDESSRTISIFTKDYDKDTSEETEKPEKSEEPSSSSKPTATPSSTSKPSASPSASGKPTATPKATEEPSSGTTSGSSSGSSVAATFNPKNVKLSLSASKTKAEVGDVVDVYVNVKGIEGKFGKNEGVTGVTLTLNYDKKVLEYVEGSFELNTSANVTSVVNPDFGENKLKAAGIFVDSDKAIQRDGQILKLSFKVLSSDSASISISDGITTGNGYDTCVDIVHSDYEIESITKDLQIDKSVLKIN